MATVTEALRETVGPYGSTVDELRSYALTWAMQREDEGWELETIAYQQELQRDTGRMKFVATLTYRRAFAR